jgi:hypothetical protein
MKKLTIITLLALAVIGSSASAYNYTIVNKTNEKITVEIKPTWATAYSWVLAPSGTTIPASEALPSSVIVPPGIDDIPQAEFGDTHVFKYTGASIGLCLTQNSIKINGIIVPAYQKPDTRIGIPKVQVGIEAMGNACGDKTIWIEGSSLKGFSAQEK